jgi:hypothetical protein
MLRPVEILLEAGKYPAQQKGETSGSTWKMKARVIVFLTQGLDLMRLSKS